MKRAGIGRSPGKKRGQLFFGRKMCEGISAESRKKTQGVIFLSRGILQWNFGRGAHENGGNRAKTEACFYDINVTKAGFFAAVGQLKYNRGRRGGGGARRGLIRRRNTARDKTGVNYVGEENTA